MLRMIAESKSPPVALTEELAELAFTIFPRSMAGDKNLEIMEIMNRDRLRLIEQFRLDPNDENNSLAQQIIMFFIAGTVKKSKKFEWARWRRWQR